MSRPHQVTLSFDDLKQGVEAIDFLADPTTGTCGRNSEECRQVDCGGNRSIVAAISAPQIQCGPSANKRAAIPRLTRAERRFDFGRLTMPITANDLNTEILFEDPFFPVAGVNSKWIKKRKITLAELIDNLGACLMIVFPICIAKASVRGVWKCPLYIRQIPFICNTPWRQPADSGSGDGHTIAPSRKAMGVKACQSILIPTYPTGIVTLKNRSIAPLHSYSSIARVSSPSQLTCGSFDLIRSSRVETKMPLIKAGNFDWNIPTQGRPPSSWA